MPTLERILYGPEPFATDVCFPKPLVRDPRLATRFLELHRRLVSSAWALERETLLADWLRDAGDGPQSRPDESRGAARRDLLERGADVAAVAQATGFFDQSHLHRHFRRALGMTPARYARLTAQTYKTHPPS